MRRIIRGVLAAVVLIFCFCAVGMTGRDSGTTESREEEAVPESRETEAETGPESRRAEEETMDTENAFYSTEITDELMERMRGKSWKDSCTRPREGLR